MLRTAALLAAWFSALAMAQSPPAATAPAIPTTPVTPASAPTLDPQRMADLLAIVEGQNTPQARRTGVRELLRADSFEADRRLAQILGGNNRPAKVAIAGALAELPQQLNEGFLTPLASMLDDADPEARRSAAIALASFPNGAALERLREAVFDSQRSAQSRVAAIDALSLMTRREAVASLIDALADPQQPIFRPALAALERLSGQNFQSDPSAARNWWRENSNLPPAVWQQLQIERLSRAARDSEQRIHDLEQRLAGALRESFLRRPDAERTEQLTSLLSDPLASVRLVGLDLLQDHVASGKTPPPEVQRAARQLLEAAEPAVRALAVRTVAGLRDAADAERFSQLLATERNPDVRSALAYGLGYAGSSSSARVLLTLSEATTDPASLEAVDSLGRLAERGMLDAATRETVVAGISNRFDATPREDVPTRERLLRTLHRVADARFAPRLIAALDATEPASIRQIAVSGLAGLVALKPESGAGDAPTSRDSSRQDWLDALINVAGDADGAVRAAAIDALAQFGAGESALQALWGRLSLLETDAAIRDKAWSGVLRLLAGRPVAELDAWARRLPEIDDRTPRWTLDLLLLEEKSKELSNEARAELRVRIAGLRAAEGDPQQALAGYASALAGLGPERQIAAKAEMLRLALASDRLDAGVAETLRQEPRLPSESALELIQAEIRRRLEQDDADRALNLLAQLEQNPPMQWSDGAKESLENARRRAAETQARVDAERVRSVAKQATERSDSESLRAAVATLGPRAIELLREALRSEITSSTPDSTSEAALQALLRTAAPEWPGFSPDAPASEKLRALGAVAPSGTTQPQDRNGEAAMKGDTQRG
ncbi:MAG: HEAT repeat domain-containing protein [Phycisphaerae bacterium]